MAWQDNEENFCEEDFTEDEDDDELYYYMDEDGEVDLDAYIHDQDSDYPMCGDWS